MSEIASWLPLVSQSIVVGLLGGAGLVLTHLYSQRGPLVYPVYAAILAALAFVSAHFEGLPYLAHLSAVLAGMFVATAIVFSSRVEHLGGGFPPSDSRSSPRVRR